MERQVEPCCSGTSGKGALFINASLSFRSVADFAIDIASCYKNIATTGCAIDLFLALIPHHSTLPFAPWLLDTGTNDPCDPERKKQVKIMDGC